MSRSSSAEIIIENITNRRSIRRYRPDPIPSELIEELLQAAIWAPSAHNRQPWRFAVAARSATKKRLAIAMGESLRQDLEADGLDPIFIQRDLEKSYTRITQAPVIILIAVSLNEMDEYPDERRRNNELTMAVQSAAMAGQNLLLSADALGLGACWMCAPLFCPEVVVKTLNLSADWRPQGLITLGYPAEERQKSRDILASKVAYLD